MKFVEYLWFLAHGVLKRTKKDDNDVYKLFNAAGNILDAAKTNIFLVRRQGLIATASGKALDYHGRGRRLPRYAGELDEQYKKRLLSKREISEKAGTVEGVILAVKSMGFDRVEHEPLYLEDPERWAEFYIYLDQDLLTQYGNLETVERVVRDVKQASSLHNFIFTYYMDMRIRCVDQWGLSDLRRFRCGLNKCGTLNSNTIGRTYAATARIQSVYSSVLQTLKVSGTMASGKVAFRKNIGMSYPAGGTIQAVFEKRLKPIQVLRNDLRCGRLRI